MRLVEGIAHIDDLDAFLSELTTIGDDTDCTVQAFDARYVVDRTHLQRALELADRAINRGENVARDRGVEVMLYAAGRRQIDRALTVGVSEGECPVVVLVATEGGSDDADRDDAVEATAADAVADLLSPAETLGEFDESLVREYFDVSDRELAATDGTLADVIHERVALLDVRK
ncbi:KEOPS complex subunit Cgi121 [Halobaculum limi]|uniref:KEOPS complex subunit Cgi121 n=1 Tax=Halobaculum limi TaxID=3031916 RepID=UPI0024070529|nr:KEOPS complex subunit Cgi121 [Halobaculum sp. YSMS11]